MDGGSFYSRGMSLNLSRSPAPGMAYSPMQPFAPEHMPLASSAGMHVEQRFPEIGFGQKLDQVVSLIREQVSETASIKEELCSLRSEMNELKQNSKIITESVSSSTASTPVAAVKKIPAELSTVVKLLHEKADSTEQFIGAEPYSSRVNQSVKEYLVSTVSEQYSEKFSPKRIKRSVHRYYESRRRLFNDSKPERVEVALQVQMDARRKERRKRLYKSRKKQLRTSKEEKRWSQLSYKYMSEESEGSDGDKVNRHPLNWRSEKLNKLVCDLDQRARSSAATLSS